MIAEELKVLFDELKTEISLLKAEITLISYDTTKIREQLDRIESKSSQPQESVSIIPNTPPPTFIPPEYL